MSPIKYLGYICGITDLALILSNMIDNEEKNKKYNSQTDYKYFCEENCNTLKCDYLLTNGICNNDSTQYRCDVLDNNPCNWDGPFQEEINELDDEDIKKNIKEIYNTLTKDIIK